MTRQAEEFGRIRSILRTGLVIDGQRQPKPAAAPVNLIDPDLQLAGLPLVFEGLSLREWHEVDGWIDTEPAKLEERGA